ncbi:MAG: Rieske 2Fe-2S domain-containing protein [Burkholderiaceae bacterium]
MLSPADNILFTRTAPQTAMGDVFRRFWIPAALGKEVATKGDAPKRIRLLGEDLLICRHSDGQVMLTEPRCPHRGADLYWGRNEDCGLRCVYHGWKFRADGQCVDIPNMAAGSARDNLMAQVKIRTYPTHEAGDLIWAYLGPGEPPPMHLFEFCEVPGNARYVSKKLQECNWAQAVEGAIDTAHFSFVHRNLPGSSVREVYEDDRAQWINNDGAPRYEILDHAAGMTLAGERRANPGNSYWRIAQFLLPCHSLAPGAMPGETFTGQSFVPIDDESCWIYTYAWNPQRSLTDDELQRYEDGRSVHAIVDEHYVPLRNRSNEYMIDRQLQKTGNFTGITGLSEQDAAIQDSQGRIADRRAEALVPSDIGVVRFRQLMIGMARSLHAGDEPAVLQAALQSPDSYGLRSGGVVTRQGLSLEQAMIERFGNRTGKGLIAESERGINGTDQNGAV